MVLLEELCLPPSRSWFIKFFGFFVLKGGSILPEAVAIVMAMASVSVPGAQAGKISSGISGTGLSSPRSGGSVRVISGDGLVNSLKVGLSGLVVRDKVFLKDVRWRGRASRMWSGVPQSKRLVAHTRAMVRLT